MTDINQRMRSYLERLGDKHHGIVARLLKKREVGAMAELPDDDLFAFGEELRASANLPTSFMLARARGFSLEGDDDPYTEDEIDTPLKKESTANAINEMALALYEKADGKASLIDAVPSGASTREAIAFMAQAAASLRKLDH